MADPPDRGFEAAGTRSVAAGQIGVAATGDQAHIDARVTNLAAGAIPEPTGVAAPARTHNLPRPPVRVFVGREAALGQIHSALADKASAVVTQAVYGLGGVGKSELALQHAAACQADYTLIWWITAEDEAQVDTGLAALAARLCPEIAMAGTTGDAAKWAIAWLQTHRKWLLILDNVNNPAEIGPLLGQLVGGHILVTTRRDTGWDQIANPIRLDVLEPDPAAELITSRTGRHDNTDQDAAASIAAELGRLPLALDQAAAYISQTRITPATYLQRLQQHPAVMYAASGTGQDQRTISRVWDITIEAIRARQPSAIKLLHILACYASDGIPRVILGGRDDTDHLAMDEALGMLASYSMITLTPDAVSMHRLVQAVISARQPERDENTAFGGDDPLAVALSWLDDAIPDHPDTNVAEWPLLRAIVPHAESLSNHYQLQAGPQRLGRLQNEIGLFLNVQGDYERALAFRESALRIYETVFGPDHPRTATLMAGLAVTYVNIGRLADAIPLEERALQITENTLGPDHPNTATWLNNLALSYADLGRYDDAVPLAERALRITENALGPDHYSTAIRLGNLATIYYELGRYNDAVPFVERAVRITKTTLGPDHPNTALQWGNLANLYKQLGRYDEALPLEEQVLRITENTLGPDHPDTATCMLNLADSYTELRRYDEAMPLGERALQIFENTLGPNHPSIAICMENLAVIYADLGQYNDAIPLAERAVHITENALGPDHPRSVRYRKNLASLNKQSEKYDDA